MSKDREKGQGGARVWLVARKRELCKSKRGQNPSTGNRTESIARWAESKAENGAGSGAGSWAGGMAAKSRGRYRGNRELESNIWRNRTLEKDVGLGNPLIHPFGLPHLRHAQARCRSTQKRL